MAVTQIGQLTVSWDGPEVFFPQVGGLRRNRGHLFFLGASADAPKNLYSNLFARYTVDGEVLRSGLIQKYFPVRTLTWFFIPVPEFTGDNNTEIELIVEPKGFFGTNGETYSPDLTLFYDDDRAVDIGVNTI